MILELDDAVFALQGRQRTSLKELIYQSLERHHRVVTNPEFDEHAQAAVNAWLDCQEDEREELQLVFEWGTGGEEDPDELSQVRILVTPEGPDNWRVDPPSVSLPTARTLVEKALVVLLEDDDDDASFVRVMARAAGKQKQLDEAETAGSLHFDSFGGKSQILKRLERDILADDARLFRTVVLFDSDARRPWRDIRADDIVSASRDTSQTDRLKRARMQVMPGENAALMKVCEDAARPVPFHATTRRTIENYVPLAVLHLRAQRTKGHRDRAAMQKAVKAFGELSEAQRHHYNMKSGFNDDSSADARRWAGDLYNDVPKRDRDKLASGFDTNRDKLAAVFGLDPDQDELAPSEDQLRREGVQAEAGELIMTILERL